MEKGLKGGYMKKCVVLVALILVLGCSGESQKPPFVEISSRGNGVGTITQLVTMDESLELAVVQREKGGSVSVIVPKGKYSKGDPLPYKTFLIFNSDAFETVPVRFPRG
jgi:hypothetical protein